MKQSNEHRRQNYYHMSFIQRFKKYQNPAVSPLYSDFFFLSGKIRIFIVVIVNQNEFNPIALRTAKTLWSFDLSECNRAKVKKSQEEKGMTTVS